MKLKEQIQKLTINFHEGTSYRVYGLVGRARVTLPVVDTYCRYPYPASRTCSVMTSPQNTWQANVQGSYTLKPQKKSFYFNCISVPKSGIKLHKKSFN